VSKYKILIEQLFRHFDFDANKSEVYTEIKSLIN